MREHTRRSFLSYGIGAATFAGSARASLGAERPQRTVVVMCDGFGVEYFDASPMPTLKKWASQGVFVETKGVMPSVTNCNNVSICCGAWPSQHGITGNSYFNETTGQEDYMEDGALVMAPTIFERAKKHGVSSALLTSKKKTATLLGRGADIVLAAEAPGPDWEAQLGKAPEIYSREINYWLFEAALSILAKRPEIGVVYVHTTDYPMHTWPPEAKESQEHLAKIDSLLDRISQVAPDAAVLLTADHGLNFKKRCWDLDKALEGLGAPIRISISAERDKYVKHHRGMGGTAWVYLKEPGDLDKVRNLLQKMDGIETVLTRAQAADTYHLMASRIGDLVVFGDKDTVFGNLDSAMEALPATYRSHGSRHELNVPIVIHNCPAAPEASFYKSNLDIARWLYAT
jgi:phosphonoacetate hydrolase